MRRSAYTVLGWVVWKVGTRLAKRKLAENRLRLGAAGVVAAVLVAGALAAKTAAGDDG